jgi:hypothetical protein
MNSRSRLGKHYISNGNSRVPYNQERTSMRQQHTQCDLPLLRHQLAALNDLDFGELLWTVLAPFYCGSK